jgi:twitching motility protein PilT
MANLDLYLQTCIDQKCSDLHIAADSPICVRQLGRLLPISEGPLPPAEAEALIFEILDPATLGRLKEELEVDGTYSLPNGERFRYNAYRQRKGWDAVFRHFSPQVRTIDGLGLPPILKKFADANQGMILITGPGRCGKSTTCAALVDYLNETTEENIITIEDPIEYLHHRKQSVVNQRGVGPHTASFSSALRSALREDPDIIMVGEMRDHETMSLALTAAETGHLVIGTLHTGSATSTVSRVVSLFPAGEQPQAIVSLAENLVGIVSQRLLVNAEGNGMVAAFEILVNVMAVSNVIREGEFFKIPSLITTGTLHGMQTMETALKGLVAAKKITQAVADEILAEET